MVFSHSIVLLLALVGSSLAFTAEYVPKSYYVIYNNGEKSPVVSLRDKRSIQDLIPLVRMRRSEGSAGSYSGSFSSSSSGAGAGDAVYFADNIAKGIEAVKKLSGFPDGFPGGIPGGVPPHAFAGSGFPQADGYGNGIAPNLHSRFGGDDGVSYSGSAQGAKGVYSASSSSIDGDGNVKYSVKTGKF